MQCTLKARVCWSQRVSSILCCREALESCLVMLQSSVSGCVQLASLVEQTLSPPSSTTTASQLWHTPSAIVYVLSTTTPTNLLCYCMYVCIYVYACCIIYTFTNHLKPNFYGKKCNECVSVAIRRWLANIAIFS